MPGRFGVGGSLERPFGRTNDEREATVNVRMRICAALACLLAAGAIVTSPASARLAMGIGDEHAQAFTNPSFTALGVKRTRLITAYDSALSTSSAPDAWMNAARLAHEEIVVAFNPGADSRCPGRPCKPVSSSQYTKAFVAFHKRYPFVHIFQPWNEVNSLTQPTALHPEAVVTYYAIVKRYCPSCTVLGADLEDLAKGPGVPAQIDMVNYAKTLLRDFGKAHVRTPQLWGLHNYVDVNYFHSSGTRAALSVLPGQLWLTETGGIAEFTLSSGTVRLRYDLARQAKATNWMMQLALSNKRIQRIYIYDLFYAGANRFDSSLLGPDLTPRKAYYSLTAHWKKYFG